MKLWVEERGARREEIANTLNALSTLARLQLLDLLVQHSGPSCVCDLIPRFAQRQPTIRHYLRILRQAQSLETENRGTQSDYWVTDRSRTTLSAAFPVAGKK